MLELRDDRRLRERRCDIGCPKPRRTGISLFYCQTGDSRVYSNIRVVRSPHNARSLASNANSPSDVNYSEMQSGSWQILISLPSNATISRTFTLTVAAPTVVVATVCYIQTTNRYRADYRNLDYPDCYCSDYQHPLRNKY